MKLRIDREDSIDGTTFGHLLIDRNAFCLTLEDEVREAPGRPVAEWKVQDETAFPAGVYDLGLVDSKHFGPDTIAILGVPGYTDLRIHGGTTKKDTDGCVLVGDHIDREKMTISGAKFDHVLEKLKAIVVPVLKDGEKVKLQVRNGPGWYERNGLLMPEEV